MSVPTLSASTSATPAPVIYQAPVNMPLPTYDWNVADQMHEFRLFKCLLNTWIQLCKIKAGDCLDYLLSSWARKVTQLWTVESQPMKPINEIQRNSSIILTAPWMMRSPQVQVYELEDIKKRSDKSINDTPGYTNLPAVHR